MFLLMERNLNLIQTFLLLKDKYFIYIRHFIYRASYQTLWVTGKKLFFIAPRRILPGTVSFFYKDCVIEGIHILFFKNKACRGLK